MTIIAFGSTALDIFEFSDIMSSKGWHLNALQKPSRLLQNNNISGPIPIELRTVPLLQTLDLSNNRKLNKYLDLVFLKIDCNQDNKPLAKELGIKVVPTFKILKDKKVVKEVTGAKFDDLVHAIDTVRSN
uniref:Thioredoxin domain-containing protein n=1 Tax=Cucumis melo TaxID=3656 RepID=A0A9I9EBS7_CUCME